jgi:hypothetical protein
LAALKFFVVADPSHPNLDTFLQSVYGLYIDYALKVRSLTLLALIAQNPFYKIDQPIHCEQFDIELSKLMAAQQSIVGSPTEERRP